MADNQNEDLVEFEISEAELDAIDGEGSDTTGKSKTTEKELRNEPEGTNADSHEAGDGADDDDEPDEPDDTHADSASATSDDDDREEIRKRRRQERLDRKARAREREESMRRELSSRDTVIAQMRAELDEIKRRNAGGELAQLNVAKQRIAEEYQATKDRIRVATEAGNGAEVAEATERLIQLRDRANKIVQIEKAHQQNSSRPQPLDPRIANNAKDWTEKHPWYNPAGKDNDSRIVLAIDSTLAEEGWDPTTRDYWDELDARIKKYLPHRVNRGIITPRAKSTVAGSGRETGAGKSTGVFKLSAARVQAIKDLGDWDDPVARNKRIKEYRDYDRANQGA